MDIKEIERVVATVQQAVFRNANSIAIGVLRSRFKGAGLQFREHQVYAPGDDVRFIDWKLSARTGHVYVKTFEEDRNVEICVLLDISKTSFYGSRGVSKLQMALEICGLLFILAGKTQDNVRIIFFWDGKKIELLPKRGREGLTQFITVLEREKILEPGGKVNISKHAKLQETSANLLISSLRQQLSRRKEVVYLGDMLSFPQTDEARKLTTDSHFHAVRLLSPIDQESLRFSVTRGIGKAAGLGRPKDQMGFLSRFPVITSDERYLEKFLRKIT